MSAGSLVGGSAPNGKAVMRPFLEQVRTTLEKI